MPKVNLPGPEADQRGNVQGWLQVDKRVHQKMWQFGLKNPTALSVLHFLTSRLARGSNGVVMSYAAMSSAMGIAERTSKNAIAALAQAKFIQILKSGRVTFTSSIRRWRGPAFEGQICCFSAEILVSEEEQATSVDQLIDESKALNEVPQLFGGERLLVGNEELDPPDQGELNLP